MDILLRDTDGRGLTDEALDAALTRSLAGRTPRRVLILPPDITRFHSYAGHLANRYYHLLATTATVDVMPALGTHVPMSEAECARMFGDIPFSRFVVHDWRHDIVPIGEVPAEYVREVTDGMWDRPVVCEVNRRLVEGGYDLILSIGQVVPHEVVGMANHAKNILVGCGGRRTINESHMIGAVYGMERMMGKDATPVRKILDYAMEHFLPDAPIVYALTVTTAPAGVVRVHGLFIGSGREPFTAAVQLSQEKNIDFVDRGIRKCVVWLDPSEFRSTWLGNKAIYRTRMAIADGGELLVLAPGVAKFGEDPTIDGLIRTYGYRGRLRVLELFHAHADLQANMSAAAHLIHGSADDRFHITYAVKELTRAEVEGVGFGWADFDTVVRRYDPSRLAPGWNVLPDGEEIFFIPNPALGLWIDRNRF